MNRVDPRYKFGTWLGMRNHSAECFIVEHVKSNVIGVSWRKKDGRWTVDRPDIRVDAIPIPSLPFEGARIQRERIAKQDIDEFGATVRCPSCNAIKDNKKDATPFRSLQSTN